MRQVTPTAGRPPYIQMEDEEEEEEEEELYLRLETLVRILRRGKGDS